MKIKVKWVSQGPPRMPTYQSHGASGCDVCAAIEEELVILPMRRALVATGLAVEIPQGFEIQVRPRSGLALNKGLGILNSPGTIDADYRGEIKIIVINLGQEPIVIKPGDRVAQFVVAPVIQAEFELNKEIAESDRGTHGFGSTGLA